MTRFLPKDRLAAGVVIVTLIFYSIMLWYPILDDFALSLHSGLALKRSWVGLANFRQLTEDKYFRQAIGVTFKYALIVVPFATAFGLLLAAVMNSIRNVTVRTLFTSLFFFPNIVPLAATVSFWKFLLAPTQNGIINGFLGIFGLGPVQWLENVQTALPSLAAVSIWGGMGYVMILLLAGMQSIPRMFYEAAAIDGANAWARFWRITVPLLMPTLTFVVVVSTLGSLMMFEPVYIMTGGHVSHDPKGGPAGSTTTVIWLVYTLAFVNFKQGYAAAVAVVWFFVMLALGVIQFRVMSSLRYEY